MSAIELQDSFDALKPLDATHTLVLANGRAARYIDVGAPEWRPLVFVGGLGTSVGAFQLTEFARTTRERLRLRVIGVERNGFGETPFDPSLGYAEAAEDVQAVLAARGVERFAVAAFSGGGPLAAALAARAPERLISLHLAAAAAGASQGLPGPAAPPFAELAEAPGASWQFPADSPVHGIPGFAAAAAAEGARALPPGGPGADALAHEWGLLRSEPLPDLSAVRAPAYLYWGTNDELVPLGHAQTWRRALPNVVALRVYSGEAHDVQYRHWDQILVDAAGLGGTLICREGRTRLAPDDAARELPRGATLGLCAWRHAHPTSSRRS
jgi:non-heme chloroperoxidase